MQSWLTSKLEHITKEFLGGGGYGAVYEAQFLVYLEVREVQRGVTDFWDLLAEACKETTPKGKKLQSFSFYITDRQKLVDALAKFAHQFEGPLRTEPITPAGAQNETPASSTTEGGGMDLFDLLTGEDG